MTFFPPPTPQIDHHLEKKIGDAPQMQYSGSNVNLTITTESISLMIMESGEVDIPKYYKIDFYIFQHI